MQKSNNRQRDNAPDFATLSNMGKNNKKRAAHRNHDHGGHSKKRQRKQGGGYWINSCRESAPKEGAPVTMTVVISQSDLTDNHTHVQDKSESKAVETSKNAEEVAKAESEPPEAKKNEASVSKGTTDTTVDESLDGAKSSQGLKQEEDHSHAFISVKRLPSASGPHKVVRHVCFHDPMVVVRYASLISHRSYSPL